jgi:hypothetical protein
MDIIQLYQDFSVDYKTEGHKHCRPGWVNTPCPFCVSTGGHEGYHLGYEIETNHFVCWRCGWHPVSLAISLLIGIPEKQVYALVKKYGILVPRLIKNPEVKAIKVDFKFPSGVITSGLLPHHEEYLWNRGFLDTDTLIKTWDLMSTGPVARLGNLDYKHRIMIPFIWNSVYVSFDSRDVTNKALNKYQACPKERELIPHKEIIYCKQEALQDTAICVEGPTDVWRFGVNSFATSGIKYTPKQVRLIARMFKRVPVCFDGGEPQAIAQANKLVADLKFRGVDSFRVDIEGDPGSMKQEDADYLVKQLIK